MPKVASDIPATLRPFISHGLPLDWQGRDEAECDCPSCGRGGGKFSVNVESGQYKCFACDFRGGSTLFLRWLHEQSERATTDYDDFAADRGLLYWETLVHWGACKSIITGRWLFPAHNPDGALTQLYQRIRTPERWELRPTPEAGGHAVHGLPLLDRNADTVFLCEGPFDAMALWEALRIAKLHDAGLEFTGNPDASLAASSAVLAVPNCGAVGEPFRRYLPLFAGKRVVLCFDNDHHKQLDGRHVDGAGHAATKRAVAMLAGTAREVVHVKWGGADGGCSTVLSNGYDVRDALTKEAAA